MRRTRPIRQMPGVAARVWLRVGELLGWTGTGFGGMRVFGAHAKRTGHLDYADLKTAYEDFKFVRRICQATTNFLWAGGFRVHSEDPIVEELLNKFYAQNKIALWMGGRDAALLGRAALVPYWDDVNEKLALRQQDPEEVTRVSRKGYPWLLESYHIEFSQDGVSFKADLDMDNLKVQEGRGDVETVPNPYSVIPLVLVDEDHLSDRTEGTGVIGRQVYDLCEKFGDMLDAAFDGEKYHGRPVPWFAGVSMDAGFRQKLEEGDWGPEQGMMLTEKGSCGFLESSRGSEGQREMLKLMFYQIIAETGVPEYIFGSHMVSAQASTKEQKEVIEQVAAQRRMFWEPALLELNRTVLAMLEYHTYVRTPIRETTIEWGKAVVGNELDDAQTDLAIVEAANQAEGAGLISRESARKMLEGAGVIADAATEEEKIAEEQGKLVGQ